MERSTIHVGIDIGTSSVKVCARRGDRIVYEAKRNYPEEENREKGVQNAKSILKIAMEVLETCESFFESESLKIDELCVCGQMHGIVFWHQKSLVFQNIDSLICSPLYNWTYSNPETETFLKQNLPTWTSGNAHSGFGLVTLAEHHAHNAHFLKPFTHCGTIMDLFLTFLTSSDNVLISHHNAHSWGFCNPDATWQSDILNFVPEWLQLPRITVDFQEVVGTWHGAKCHVASGDLQASVASLDYSERSENTAYLTLGTSAQLCCLVDQNAIPPTVPPTVVQLPYSNGQKLLAACSMNGGNALEAVLKMLSPDNYSTEKLATLLEELENNSQFLNELRIDPIFIPEREGSGKFSVSGLTPETSQLEILEATHLGVIRNLFSMFPKSLLKSLSIQKLALIGSAQCARFKRHIQAETDLELTVPSSAISTPLGATRF